MNSSFLLGVGVVVEMVVVTPTVVNWGSMKLICQPLAVIKKSLEKRRNM